MFELIFDEDSQAELKQWIEERTGNKYQRDKYLGIAKDGNITACCGYECFGSIIFAHIAVTAQIPKSFLQVIFDYPFNQAGADKVIALVDKDNEKASRLVEHMGFRLVEQDKIKLYEMTKSECKWLNAAKRKE